MQQHVRVEMFVPTLRFRILHQRMPRSVSIGFGGAYDASTETTCSKHGTLQQFHYCHETRQEKWVDVEHVWESVADYEARLERARKEKSCGSQ